ncbi:MAG TPA: MarR family winged helix-turn-helix transcriptional regulator [Ktedonobacterales bacterium]
MEPTIPSDNPPSTAEMAAMTAACVCLNVRQAARAVTQLYNGILQPAGLRMSQFGTLAKIAVAGEVTLTRLAEDLVMDRTTLARNLKPLETQGLITIEPGADRRTRIVTLSARGRAALKTTLPYWRAAQEQVVTGLGEERYRALLAGLRAVTELTDTD